MMTGGRGLIFERLEIRTLLSATTVDLPGGEPVGLDLPTIHAILQSSPGSDPLLGDGPDGSSGYYDIQGYLDTGTSGILLDSDVASSFGVGQSTYNGQPVTYNDTGIAGGEGFGVSDPLTVSLAASTAANDTRGNIFGIGLGGSPPDLSEYTQSFNNLRLQISRSAVDPLTGGIDIFGTPVLQNKVMVIDPKPVDQDSTLSTYIYNPGTPFNAGAATTDPGIPTTNLHVLLSYGGFSQFTSITPPGAPGPTELDNPFIGPDPVAALSPKHPVDRTPPITMTQGANSASGSFLFDSGAQASFISQGIASKLGVHYAPGTYNTNNPVLVDANGDELPNQFVIPIGGIGGTVNAAGFYMDSLTVPTIEGPGIRFLNAPVLVTDVTVTNPTTHQSLTLDGDFGINFMIGTTDIDGFSTSPGSFDWVTYDQAKGILGLDVPNVSIIPWPTANSSASDLTSPGGSTYSFNVNYSATIGQNITAASLGSGDILVTGPHGFSQLATELSVNQPGDGLARSVTYQINAPSGTWGIGNDGDYTISVQPSQVGDTAGDFVKPQVLATFSIAIAPASIPSTGAADTYLVRVDPNSIYTEVFVNTPSSGDPTYLFSPGGSTPMMIAGAGGNDSATIDFSYGNPLASNGLMFDGGGAINSLAVIGSNDNDSLMIDGSQLMFGNIAIGYANTQSIDVNGGFGNDLLEQVAQPGAALTFGGAGAQTLLVDAGTYTFGGNPALDTSNMTVFDYSSVIFAPAASGAGVTAQTFFALNLGPGALASVADAASQNDRTVLVLGTLTQTSTSTLDLGNNDMVVHNGNLGAITAKIRTGFNLAHGGHWNGMGIISSAAGLSALPKTALGYESNSNGAGGTLVTAFDGLAVNSADVLVKYTLVGDANLDGSVNFTDLLAVGQHYGGTGTGWNTGDFNYDSTTNFNDLLGLAQNFGRALNT